MAYYGNDEDYEDPSEPYGEDEGSELEQQIAEQEAELTQAQAQSQQQFELEGKLLKNKLRAIFRDVSVSSRTSLKFTEKQTVKKAKAHPNLKQEINRVNTVLASNKVKNISKMMSSSPMLMYVLIGALVIFLLISVFAFFDSLLGGDGNNPNAVAGITGNDFYGARMVYKDDEKARSSMVEDYVELIIDGIDETKSITSITAGGGTYNVELTINLNVPGENFDYSTFNETDFYGSYQTLYDAILETSKVVYQVDNGNAYTGSSLVECVDGIKYFGFANMTEIVPIVEQVVSENMTFTAEDDAGSIVSDGTTLNQIQDSIETETANKLTTLFSNDVYSVRTEKLFVKDYILESEDAMLTGIEKENYVAMIFMPKHNVTFTKLSFMVSNTDFANFEISFSANGNTIEMQTDGANISNREGSEAYIYYADSSASVGAFDDDINTNNLSALANGMSLYDIVESVDNYETYLTTPAGESYLTIKKNGVVVNVSNTEAFNLVEFETSWQSAS